MAWLELSEMDALMDTLIAELNAVLPGGFGKRASASLFVLEYLPAPKQFSLELKQEAKTHKRFLRLLVPNAPGTRWDLPKDRLDSVTAQQIVGACKEAERVTSAGRAEREASAARQDAAWDQIHAIASSFGTSASILGGIDLPNGLSVTINPGEDGNLRVTGIHVSGNARRDRTPGQVQALLAALAALV